MRCTVRFQVLSDVIHFISCMKWQVSTTKYRKEKLEELCVGLCNCCKKSLQKFLHDLAIGALLEFRKATHHICSPSIFCLTYLYSIFFKTDILCKHMEQTEAQKLHQNLIQIVKDILCDMPQFCVILAGGSDHPITHHELNITLRLSSKRLDHLWERHLIQ